MYGYIYKTLDTKTDKIYIGQKISEVFLEDKYFGSGTIIRRIKSKCFKNKENVKERFRITLVDTADNQEELNQKEIFWIGFFNSRDPGIGYNIGAGGERCAFFTGVKHTKESRKKMSDAAKKREHPPTTLGRVCVTNGEINKVIHPCDIEYYESIGFHKGKTLKNPIVVWNKGMTYDKNESVRKYIDKRNARIKNGEHIGFVGKKGKESPTFVQDDEIIDRIINNGFKEKLLKFGKCNACKLFNIDAYGRVYKRCLELLGLSDEDVIKNKRKTY